MAALVKPVNINKVWALSGAKVDPGDAKYSIGWVAEVPTHQNFNFLQNTLSQGLAYVNENGIGAWDTATNYQIGSIVRASNGSIYHSLTADNVGNNPTSPATLFWRQGIPGSGGIPFVLDNSVASANAADVPLSIIGNDSQTANLMEVEQSGSSIFSIESDKLNTGNIDWADQGTAGFSANTLGTVVGYRPSFGAFRLNGSSSGQGFYGIYSFTIKSQDSDGFVIAAASNQSRNILSITDSSNNIIARVNQNGNVGGTGGYTDLSDETGKEEIRAFNDGLVILKKVKPKKFKRKNNDRDEVGFIANELELDFPEAVIDFDNLRKGVQTSALIPAIVNAILELDSRLTSLEGA